MKHFQKLFLYVFLLFFGMFIAIPFTLMKGIDDIIWITTLVIFILIMLWKNSSIIEKGRDYAAMTLMLWMLICLYYRIGAIVTDDVYQVLELYLLYSRDTVLSFDFFPTEIDSFLFALILSFFQLVVCKMSKYLKKHT